MERHCVVLLTQNTSNAADYKSSLPSRVEGTCQWILSNSQFRDWSLQQETCLLWISGYPGSGKTILSAYLLDHLDAAASPNLQTTLCYFFCDGKIETQRDGTAILRSLIHHLVVRCRSLIKYVKRAYDIQGPQLDRNFSALWKVFLAISSDRRVRPISVIIDAIDECEDITRDRLLAEVSTLISTPSAIRSRPSCVKFLVTSRPQFGHQYTSNILQIDSTLENVDRDLRLVIRSKVEGIVRRTACGPDVRAYIENALYSKADRTFLWVHLVLRILEAELSASQAKFKLIVDQLPKTLAETYERFLYGISTEHQHHARQLLHLVVGSLRPLTLAEMRVLLAIQDHHRTLESMEEDALFNIQAYIERVLGPLVRIWDAQIYLVHQSLKDFLLSLSTESSHPLSATFGIDPSEASSVLARTCITYLLLDNFEHDIYAPSTHEVSPISDVDSPTGKGSIQQFWDSMNLGDDTLFNDPAELEADACARIAQQYALFDYAARYWPRHFLSVCPRYLPALQNSALILSDTSSFHGLNWFRYYWLQSEINLSRPENFSPMVTASYFGHITSLKAVLLKALPIGAGMGEHSIYWASRMGHYAIVDLLLAQGVSPDIEAVDGQTCLTAAVQFNHVNVVGRLLEDEGLLARHKCYRVNYAARGGRTPLSIAAGNGFVEIVGKLLRHPRIQPDIEDSNKWTPLFWSISGKHLDVLQLLLRDERISVNHLDKFGRNVLSWAASEGEHEMVKYLMSLNHINAHEPDQKGRTALSWAAGSGHLQTTAYLRRRIDVSTKDNEGRNALSWACSGCHPSVVEYLIKYDPEGVDEADTIGWTPLAWSLFENCPRVVQLLLDSGLVDVNKKDHGGRTALAWAASYGYLDVVQLLLKAKGIHVDSRAISCASRHPDILKLLQEHVE